MIKVLDQETINQIAAGEVVERPASVVKELVENAIDAASTAITVEIKGGGIDFIRITDNGQGIPKEQVRTAFLRHATSKIESAKDLEVVGTLGFRGEALSSIAAIAKVELITKTDEGISGVRYEIEGGQEMAFEEVGCPEGTTFVIRNIFYNTPARRKFLKTMMTEAGYVEAFIQRLALSHPDISFKFINDNKNKIATSGNGNLKDVIYQLYGRDVAMNLLPVSLKEDDFSIEGFIGKPVISRGNRNYENYFVNGRYLKNNTISKAIEEGYKGHAMVHKFPFTVLMLQMNPHSFDANVHPAKMEMRFHNGERLYVQVMSAVKNAFVKKDLIPRVMPGKDEARQKPVVPSVPEPFEKKRKAIEERFQNLTVERKQEIAATKKSEMESEANPMAAMPENSVARPSIEERLAKLKLGTSKPDVAIQKVREEIDEKMHTPVPEEKVLPVREPEVYGSQMSFADDPLLAKETKPRHKIIGQVFKTYWMVEFDDKLFFVDQHAAHEKVLYEKFKKDLENRAIDSQMIAPPIVLNFSIREREKFLKFQKHFERLGYLIEEFGSDAYCIRAVPANLTNVNQQQLFVELLDQIEEGSVNLDLELVTDRLATMACKAAVKGNRPMSEAEMDSLMDQLMELENPYQCPHGRPTIISMTKYELDKKFKRIQS